MDVLEQLSKTLEALGAELISVSRRLVTETVRSTSLAKTINEIDSHMSKLAARRADLSSECGDVKALIEVLEVQQSNLQADREAIAVLIAKRSTNVPSANSIIPSDRREARVSRATQGRQHQSTTSGGSRKARIRAMTLQILETADRPQSRQDLYAKLQARKFAFEGQESPARAIQKALYRWNAVVHFKGQGYWLASREHPAVRHQA
ncbi:hypothetical protein [Rhizobium ruizarguesonis]|uniref:hypothetical protein n=1 Tax=Rhizobium ruizarguesonis TaxID=2081791 RepID=UPI00371639B4